VPHARSEQMIQYLKPNQFHADLLKLKSISFDGHPGDGSTKSNPNDVCPKSTLIVEALNG